MFGNGAGVRGFIETFLLEADRIGANGGIAARPHHRRDHRGIDASGEKGAKRYIGHEPPPDGIAEQGFQRVAGLGIAEVELLGLAALGRGRDRPERRGLDMAGGVGHRDMSGLELIDVAIDRMRRRHIGEAHIGRERIRIELGAPVRQRLERLELGGEDEAPVLPAVIERLDAEPVADEAQAPRLPVPDREGEHPDQALDALAQSPFGDGLDQNLGVGMAFEAAALGFEFRPEALRRCRSRHCS